MSPKNKKSLLIATFLRLGIVASSPDRRLRSESAAKWLYCGSFPLCGSEGESPIAKKLQKARYFCFCDWLIVAMGQSPPRMNRIRTEIRACTCRATKTARRRFRSQIYGWASRIRTYITGTKNQGPAIGRWPSVCHKAFCDYNVSGMVKPNKQPIRQNATTQYERRHATYRERRTYRALSSQNATALAAATLRESTPCAIGIFTV